MAAMSDYLESALVGHIFRTATYTKPTVLSIALCSAAVSDTDTGALSSKELGTIGGYTRQTLNPLDANWSTVSSGTTSNQSAITFATASADWGTVSYVAICDNSTIGAGNLLFYGALTSTKIVTNGDTLRNLCEAA